jgi:hypothetical protein
MSDSVNETILMIIEAVEGGLINSADMALKLAELIFENRMEKSDVELQYPFRVTDQGDSWLVQGSLNIERLVVGPGAVRVVIRKRDAKIMSFSQDRKFQGE